MKNQQPLVKVLKSRVYFSGLTLERVSNNEMNIYVAIEDNGNTTEHKFIGPFQRIVIF